MTSNIGPSRRGLRRLMQVVSVEDAEPHLRTVRLQDGRIDKPIDFQGIDCIPESGLTNVAGKYAAPDGKPVWVWTENGTISVECEDVEVDILIIGAGGWGGAADANDMAGGGGGAGGTVIRKKVKLFAGNTYSITVGQPKSEWGNANRYGDPSIVWIGSSGEALNPATATAPANFRALGGGHGGQYVGTGPQSAGGCGGGGGVSVINYLGFRQAGGGGQQGGAGGSGSAPAAPSTITTRYGVAGGGGGSYASSGQSGYRVGYDNGIRTVFRGRGGIPSYIRSFGFWTGAGGDGGGGGSFSTDPVIGLETTTDPELLTYRYFYSGAATKPSSTVFGKYGAGGNGGALRSGVVNTSGTQGIVLIKYDGPSVPLALPEEPTGEAESDGRIRIDVDEFPPVIPDGYSVRVEYSIRTDGVCGTVYQLAGTLTRPGSVYTAPLPPNTEICVRLVAEASGFAPVTQQTPTTIVGLTVATLSSLRITIADDVATVRWTAGVLTSAITLEYDIHPIGDTPSYGSPVTFLPTPAEYVIPEAVPTGSTVSVRAIAFENIALPEGGLLGGDDFNRADGPLGSAWTNTTSSVGGWSVLSNEARASANSSSFAWIQDFPLRNEVFLQVNFLKEDNTINNGSGLFGIRQGTNLQYRVQCRSNNINILRGGTSLNTNFVDFFNDTRYDLQFYVGPSLQQAWTVQGTSQSTDSTYNSAVGTYGLYNLNAAGVIRRSTFDDFLAFTGKFLTITGAPTGWKAEVVNSSSSVVASATESGGQIKIDLSRFGSAAELAPAEGWPTLLIKDGSDVVQQTVEYDQIGNAEFPFYPGQTISYPPLDVSDEGLTYQTQASRLLPSSNTAAGYVQATDPGAVGAGLLWIDTSDAPECFRLYLRDDSNTSWIPMCADITEEPES
jgi:hypothetical protein